jgi:hypothetical protein
MFRLLISGFIGLCFFSPSAVAQSCSGYPWTPLSNGNPADASQVMGNFNCVLSSPSFSGNVTIGGSTAGTALAVQGQSYIGRLTSGPLDVLTVNVTGPNYAQFYDPGQIGPDGGLALGGANTVTGVPSAAAMFWNTSTGNVGIGTTHPNVPLSVVGQTYIDHAGLGSPDDILTLNITGPNYAQFYDAAQSGSAGGLAIGGANAVTGVPGSAIMFWNANTGQVGIGTTLPSRTFDIISSIADTTAGNDAIRIATNGTSGYGAQLILNSTSFISGHSWAFVSAGSSDSAGIGKFVIADNSSGNNRFVIDTTGNVGIGTTSPAQTLEVNGEIKVDNLASASSTSLCINANVIASCSSSLRYKEDIHDASFGLKEVNAMRPVIFKWKGRDEKDFGLIAEEVAEINPQFVTYMNGKIEGVKYPQLVAVLVGALKEQEAEIKALREDREGDRHTLRDLRTHLGLIERQMGVRTAQKAVSNVKPVDPITYPERQLSSNR